VDVGALVTPAPRCCTASAQTGTMRTYVNVRKSIPVDSAGQTARLSVSNLPGRHSRAPWRARQFARPNSRTLAGGTARAECGLRAATRHVRASGPEQHAFGPALLVPSEALISRGEGAGVAVVARTTPCISRKSRLAATMATVWKCSAACRKRHDHSQRRRLRAGRAQGESVSLAQQAAEPPAHTGASK